MAPTLDDGSAASARVASLKARGAPLDPRSAAQATQGPHGLRRRRPARVIALSNEDSSALKMRTLDCYPAGIIEPAQTRAVVSIALAAAAHAPVAPTDFGVFRM